MTQQYGLTSIAAPLSSTGISHHNLLPHIPSVSLQSTAALTRGTAPQSLNSSPQPLRRLGCVWLQQGLILIPFRLPQISCFTLSLKCFTSDSNNCSSVGIGLLLQFPHLPSVGPVLQILLCFPPSSLVLPSFTCFYIFFCTGHVLLSAFNWCSAFTSVSEGVFLMYPWREL